jgi:hypothetical protein
VKKCEHCGTEYDPRDPDHVRSGGAGHLPWLCRDILKTQRDEAVAWQAAKQEWIDVATRTLATIPADHPKPARTRGVIVDSVAGPSRMAAMSEPIMQFFAYAHLPEKLQAISKPFCELAMWVEATLPRNAERTVTLRKLLEAKDAAVRAFIAEAPPPVTVVGGPDNP